MIKTREYIYLFICLANMNRSPTAQEVCQNMARERELPVRADSAGLSGLARKPLNRDLVKKADLVFVMEAYMKNELEQVYGINPGRVVVLGIPDVYERNDPVLVRMLRGKLKPYLTGYED